MKNSLVRQIRIEQSCRRLDHLRETIETWLARRGDDDQLGQYDTQLEVLRGALVGSVAALRTMIEGLAATQATDQVYAACRANDTRAELVRRVFEYYRGKFDQREDAIYRPILKAADEVVWSCWAEPFRNAQHDDPTLIRRPAPLPYIEPRYSPAAIPREDPPADLS